MTPILSTDGFDAFSVANGFLIKEKKKSAKKFGLMITAVGLFFTAISFLNLAGIVGETIYNIFFYVFRWGGILLFVMGVITYIVKGLMVSSGEVLIDREKREVNLRGKIIPFAEIGSVTTRSQETFGRHMVFLILDHKGKMRPLISGAVLTDSSINPGIEQFVRDVDSMVKG